MSMMPGGPHTQYNQFNLLDYLAPRRRGPMHSGAAPRPASPMMKEQQMKQAGFKPAPVAVQEPRKKGWWGGFKDRMNLDNETLFLSGLGLLAGDRNTGPQMMMQNLAYGIDANKAAKADAEQQAKLNKFKKGLTPEQAMLFDVAPQAVAGGMAEQMFQDPRDVTYGNSLTQAIDADGNPVFIRPDSAGGISAVDGYSPMPRSQELNSDRVQSTFVRNDGMLMQVMRDGTTRESGSFVRNPFQISDVGGVPTAINRQTAEVIPLSTPEEVGRNRATVETTVANEEDRRIEQRDLPQYIINAEQSVSTIKQAIEHPGFDARYGFSSLSGIRPPIPDTPEAEAQAMIEQIGGQAFLEAFESLKGGGHITEIEGAKATAARTRMLYQAQGAEAARRAANEFIGYIEKGIERAKAASQGSYAVQGVDAPPLVYNPDTGDFE